MNRRAACVRVQPDTTIVALDTPETLAERLLEQRYLASEELSTALFLAIKLGKPVLLEGPAGVGKTEAAKAVAALLGRDIVRLQCYEGIDAAHALYEWNYQRQLLALRRSTQLGSVEIDLYSDEFLIERPLMQVLKAPDRKVLLIDEIDRADDEFEAFLLEFLSDFQISIPETGTVRAQSCPVVVLTSNRTRELHEALRRRCVYHWMEYPGSERESRIVMLRAEDVAERTALAVANAVQGLRAQPLAKPPGIVEAVEWAKAATLLERGSGRWPEAFKRSIGMAIKNGDDLEVVAPELDAILERACS